jgi:tetratricopeptide (TPR) repeat protein
MAMFVATEPTVPTEHGELEAGRRWLRRADAAATRVGVDQLGAARLDYVRGNLHLLDNQLDAAIEQLEPALALFERADQDHQDPLFAAHTATALGMAVHAKGDRQRALELFGRSLALFERVHGPRHPDLAHAAYNLGQTSLEAGDTELAQAMLERAVEIWTHADELELHATGRAQLVLGQLALAEGRSADGLEYARTASTAFERSASDTPGEVAIEQAEAASLIATAHYFLAEPEPAILAYRRAIRGYADAYGADDVYVAYFRVGLGWALLAAGQVEDARVEFESAYAVIEAKHGGAEQQVDVRFGLISVDIASARLEPARARLAELELRELAGMELIELELVRGVLALRRKPADPRAGASALARARAHAKTVALGEATLEILLDSLGATPQERRLAGESSRGSAR